jgi:IclR family transcriptional regulator, positive regulator for flagellar biogenesis
MSAARPPEGALLTVERGMQVLRAFRCNRGSLSNAELVRRTGLSKATVSRLTSTLLEVGFLRHTTGGREFELATGAIGIGHAFLAGSELAQAAGPRMQQLADALNVSVAIAVGDGLEMLYVAYKAGRQVATLRMGMGSVVPMGPTSLGHGYLWGLPAEERERLVAALQQRAGPHAQAMAQSMQHSFEQLASVGTCAVLNGHRQGAYGVSLPIVVGRERVPMVLSCGRADIRPDIAREHKRIDPAIKAAAAELERVLADIEL